MVIGYASMTWLAYKDVVDSLLNARHRNDMELSNEPAVPSCELRMLLVRCISQCGVYESHIPQQVNVRRQLKCRT